MARKLRPTLPSAEYLWTILDYNPETGDLRWKPRPGVKTPDWNKRHVGQLAGTVDRNGFRTIAFDCMSFEAAHIAWKMHYGCDPNRKVDFHDRSYDLHNAVSLSASNLHLVDDPKDEAEPVLDPALFLMPTDHVKNANSQTTGDGVFQTDDGWFARYSHDGRPFVTSSFPSFDDAVTALAKLVKAFSN